MGALRDSGEQGSSLVEMALVMPCLALVVYGSAALTDVLVLKLKAAEAARFALWETTAFKSPRQIDAEVRERFADLRSPRRVRQDHTGLLLHPLARDLTWRATVDSTTTSVPLGGSSRLPTSRGAWGKFVDALAGAVSKPVDEATAAMKLDTHGAALARVSLTASGKDPRSRTLDGTPLAGEGGRSGSPRWAARTALQAPLASHRPLQLVFDTWKAWPRPAPYSLSGAGTDVRTSPRSTYPEVEKQVSAQVRAIAFLGANRIPGFDDLNALVARIFRLGVTRAALGGTLPDVFSTDRMDDVATNRGPITILPPEPAEESWVPHRCEIAGRDVACPTHRLGDVTGVSQTPRALDEDAALGEFVDRSRYTVPYRIHAAYWKRSGGMDRELESRELERVPERMARDNGYVRTYRCRGHFFGGSRKPQVRNSLGDCG